MATSCNATGVAKRKLVRHHKRVRTQGGEWVWVWDWVPRTCKIAVEFDKDAALREAKANPTTVRKPWQVPDGPLNPADGWVVVPCVSQPYLQSWWPAFLDTVAARRNGKKLAFTPGDVKAAVRKTRLSLCYKAAVYEVVAEGRAPRFVAKHYGLSLGSLKVACTRVRHNLSAKEDQQDASAVVI